MSDIEEPSPPGEKPGLIRRMWNCLGKPGRWALGTTLLAGMTAGIVGAVGFNVAIEATGTNEFCISCHEMRDTPYQEYLKSAHFINDSGVQAGCSDCHAPKAFFPLLQRKIEAGKEVYGHLTGVIDTPEKYEARRLQMAEAEWARMRESDSVTCRSCHTPKAMRDPVLAAFHAAYEEDKSKTCIDCHKGVAHRNPAPTVKPVRAPGGDPTPVPHDIAEFTINLRTNDCLACHGKTQSPAGATAINPSHYVGADGKILGELAPDRFFCTACHLPPDDEDDEDGTAK